MMSMKRKSTSPGEILREEFLIPLRITQKKVAEYLRCDFKVINRMTMKRRMSRQDLLSSLLRR
jgi:antitoxin HigA-1